MHGSSIEMSTPARCSEQSGLYLVLISVHGLIRGEQMELGRDADTGGQIKYVVELARALAARPEVCRVDLLTRQVIDTKVSDDYSVAQETLADGAFLIRLPFGPKRYLRKETLWPHLDSMADQALKHIRAVGRVPDILHSHYADAGYVGARLAGLLGIPLIHTGHSLGREKLRRLRDQGVNDLVIERQYQIRRRIEAEEMAMDSASLVIASTRQEVEQQYSCYDNYQPQRMEVIPPGTDLQRFQPPTGSFADNPALPLITPFLRQPRKPLILALSRADERKNIPTLVHAFGADPQLREQANLLIVAGNRDRIADLDKGARRVMKELLLLFDAYDLYGHVAYPKQHHPDQVPALYQLAAKSRGLFVNPALTEPFGLTLLEAAACGLPVIATHDGGPRDILDRCKNGILFDPLDREALTEALRFALSDRQRWSLWARNGVRGTQRHYGWNSHANHYIKAVKRLLGGRRGARLVRAGKSRLPTLERLVVCNIDGTLIGDRAALGRLLAQLQQAQGRVGFGVATGRTLASTLRVLKEWRIPPPDLYITGVGSEIYYGRQLTPDRAWCDHIGYRWERQRLAEALAEVPGVTLQPEALQLPHKLSYLVDRDKAPPIREIRRYLRSLHLHANVIYSYQAYLDLLPIRASKGQALRYFGIRWGITPEQMLVAGNSGNDIEMLRGDTYGVVVGNYSRELQSLHDEPRIHFASACYADGILEGIDHYRFLDLNAVMESTDDR